MFTGIVEEIGVVKQVAREKNLSVLHVKAKKVLRGTKKGDSISVNGACLTVIKMSKGIVQFDVMRETLLKSNLGSLKPGAKVNLERALKMNSQVSGHFVTGHIDAVIAIKQKISKPNYTELVLGINKNLRRYLVPKGSVCLDGISLTVGDVKRTTFSVYLIPFTKEVTTLGSAKKNDKINIETDLLAKYILNGKDTSWN